MSEQEQTMTTELDDPVDPEPEPGEEGLSDAEQAEAAAGEGEEPSEGS